MKILETMTNNLKYSTSIYKISGPAGTEIFCLKTVISMGVKQVRGSLTVYTRNLVLKISKMIAGITILRPQDTYSNYGLTIKRTLQAPSGRCEGHLKCA